MNEASHLEYRHMTLKLLRRWSDYRDIGASENMCNPIAYCGLDCSECRAFKATIKGDSDWKKTIAKEWTEGLKTEFKPEDINCSGCKSDTISGWCRKICKVRPCAERRNLETCADCMEYPCENLKTFLSNEPMARNSLETRRKAVRV